MQEGKIVSNQQSVHVAIQQAHEPQHRREGAWVAFCNSIFMLGIGVLLWNSWDFKFHNSSGVVGWVSMHQYPKQQELIAYIGAFGCVILGVVIGLLVWGILALYYSRWRSCTLSQALHRVSWAFSGYLLAAIPLVRGQWSLPRLLLIPLGCVLITGVALWFWRKPSIPLNNERRIPKAVNTMPKPSRTTPRRRWRLVVFYILIPIVLYIYLYDGRSIQGQIDLFHEGEFLAPLNALLRGGIPFRDIYIQHGLFQNVGKAWLAALLGGPSLASLRLTERFIEPLGYLSLYLLGLQVFRFELTAVVLVLITSSQNFWISDRHALGLLAIVAIAYSLHRGHFHRTANLSKSWWHTVFADGWVISAGILTTLEFFYSTEVGLYTFAACGLFLIILTSRSFASLKDDIILQSLHRWSPLLSYGTGILIAWIPFLIYFGWYHALDDLICNSVIQCIYQIPTWGLPFPPILPALQGLVSFTTARTFLLSETFRWYLPVVVYLATAGMLVFRATRSGFWHNPFNAILLIISLEGIMLFRTALGRSDTPHLIYGSTLFWLFILIALERGITRCIWQTRYGKGVRQKLGVTLWITVLGLFVFGWYVHSVHHPLKVVQDRAKRVVLGQTLPKTFPVTWPRVGGLQIDKTQINHLRRVVDAIQQRTLPDEPIFDFSSQGAYYFFANRPSVTRYHQIAYASTPAMQREVIHDLERTQTRLVIYRTGGWFDNIDGIPAVERHPLIARYLDAHYTQAVDVDGTVILIRDK